MSQDCFLEEMVPFISFGPARRWVELHCKGLLVFIEVKEAKGEAGGLANCHARWTTAIGSA
jgi:hypothetical protein